MMMRGLFIPAILFFCAPVWAQGSFCGLLNDHTIHVPSHYAQSSEAHYDGSQLAPPASVGGTYVDPVFGCTIKRITNGPVQYSASMNHEYSSASAINSDDTLIELVSSTSGSWSINDLNGNIIVPQGSVPWGGGTGARWAPDQPKVAYYRLGNLLKKATISTTACAPKCTIS